MSCPYLDLLIVVTKVIIVVVQYKDVFVLIITMINCNYGKCYLCQTYYGKCNYGKSIYGKSVNANVTEPLIEHHYLNNNGEDFFDVID